MIRGAQKVYVITGVTSCISCKLQICAYCIFLPPTVIGGWTGMESWKVVNNSIRRFTKLF